MGAFPYIQWPTFSRHSRVIDRMVSGRGIALVLLVTCQSHLLRLVSQNKPYGAGLSGSTVACYQIGVDREIYDSGYFQCFFFCSSLRYWYYGLGLLTTTVWKIIYMM